jgi:hypothetical protein
LWIFEKKVPRETFGLKKEKVREKGENIMRSFLIYTLECYEWDM